MRALRRSCSSSASSVHLVTRAKRTARSRVFLFRAQRGTTNRAPGAGRRALEPNPQRSRSAGKLRPPMERAEVAARTPRKGRVADSRHPNSMMMSRHAMSDVRHLVRLELDPPTAPRVRMGA